MKPLKYKRIFFYCTLVLISSTFLSLNKTVWAEGVAAACKKTPQADLSFQGQVINIDTGASTDSQVTFKVVNMFHGNTGKKINVQRNAQVLQFHKEYMVDLWSDPSKPGVYSLGPCGQAVPIGSPDPVPGADQPVFSNQPYDLIFRGRVVHIDADQSPDSRVTFQVFNSYKGNARNKIDILRHAQQFDVNKDYVVFLRADASKKDVYSFGANGEARSIVTMDPPTGDKFFSGGLLDGNLKNTNFIGADLKNVDFGKSNLNGAEFNNADLSGADLSATTLKGHQFPTDVSAADDVDLTNAKFDETTLWAAGFLPFAKGGILIGGKQARDYPPLVTDVMQGPVDTEGLPHLPKLQIQQQGTYLVDGVHIGHYNQISAENNKADFIKVYIAGLQGHTYVFKKGEDSFKNLSIEGDPGLDTVMLDGCFTWEWPKGESTGTLLQ